MANQKLVLAQIKKSIREANADVLFLQEVIGQNDLHAKTVSNYPTGSQFEYLADEVWPHFAYGKNAVYSEGHHGNAILSKYPIESWRNVNISTNSWEQRGLLHATLRHPCGKVVHAFNAHLNLLGKARRRQIEAICNYIGENTGAADPLLLAGDFNDWRQKLSAPLQERLNLKEAHHYLFGRHAATFPSAWPKLALDRIYFRYLIPRRAEVFGGKVWEKLSDHLALAAEFEFEL